MVTHNPTDISIAAGGAAFREHGADILVSLHMSPRACSAVNAAMVQVAVGGGSGLDAGKSIAMTANTGVQYLLLKPTYYHAPLSGLSLLEVEWTHPVPAAVQPGSVPPVITIPTTAGEDDDMSSNHQMGQIGYALMWFCRTGTGAEMDAASMYTDTTDKIKRCVTHPACKVQYFGNTPRTISLSATGVPLW